MFKNTITAINNLSHCKNTEKIHAMTELMCICIANHNNSVLILANIINICHYYHYKLNVTNLCINFTHLTKGRFRVKVTTG